MLEDMTHQLLNWQSIGDITNFGEALMVFKALNNQSPTYLTHLFQPI